MRILLLSVLLAAVPGFGAPQSKAVKKAPTKSKPAAAQITLQGLVDQQGDNYVLISDKLQTPLAQLKGDGITNDVFARYVGVRVTITGVREEGDPPVVRVKTVSRQDATDQ